jgi:hypothetical protein
MASAAQRHISHPPTANSACVAAILNLGDHFVGPCIIILEQINVLNYLGCDISEGEKGLIVNILNFISMLGLQSNIIFRMQ